MAAQFQVNSLQRYGAHHLLMPPTLCLSLTVQEVFELSRSLDTASLYHTDTQFQSTDFTLGLFSALNQGFLTSEI